MNYYYKLLISCCLMILLTISCQQESKELSEKSTIYFNTVSHKESGIEFSNDLSYNQDINIIEFLYYYNGGGVAIGDINNDGLDDIYLTANQKTDRLYLNLGDMEFKDITQEAGIIMDDTWSNGVTMEDVNNDGYLDIYVSKLGNYKMYKTHNQLYINQGNGTFKEKAIDYGVNFSGFSTQASFFDYDNDGDMDMYLLNHSIHTPNSYGPIHKRKIKDSLAGDILYENKLNEGKNTFEDVTQKAGIYSSPLGYGLTLITSDVNSDGWIDIYVGNDFHENDYLYINNGNKTFKESIAKYTNHTSRFTMGVDIADINNDLKLDVFTLDMMPYDSEVFLKSAGEDSDKVTQIKSNFGYEPQYARNVFQLNKDNTSFTDIALATQTHATDWSWSVLMEDFDNDGLKDIFISNGIYKRPNDLNYINYISNINFAKYSDTKQDEIEKLLINEMPTLKISNIIFKNEGDLQFKRLTESAGMKKSYSNGAAYGDLDNDGDIDLVVNNINAKALLLENTTNTLEDNRNYISFELTANDKIKNPTGSKVFLYTDGKKFVKEATSTRGFLSASSQKIHFGLGKVQQVDSVKVHWLDQTYTILYKPMINQHHKIAKENEKRSKKKRAVIDKKNNEFLFFHIENNYLDYENEALIPEKLSTEGPAVAKADFNNDGLEDIFIGNAKYQSPVLYFQNKNGSYTKDTKSEFIKDIIYEDVDATVFDYDNDGDLDLYVVSGGSDNIESNLHFEDRVYLNDGNGFFTRFKYPLFKTNGSTVSRGDFNNDGYDDLFVGSRSIPGGYGLSPYSFILENLKGKAFKLVSKLRLGMVTDSQWADFNDDGLLDLVIVGDWMPITILINQGKGNFVNETSKHKLQNTNGMWNTVSIVDLDGNGQKDIIAGNAGVNFKWNPTLEKPVKLFLDDFDENSFLDPIIFYDFYGEYVPFASRDKITSQIPSLKKKFIKYEKFSSVKTIEDLTGKNENEILEIKTIKTLKSMVYLNPGESIEEIPFPFEGQLSSIEDILVQDASTILFVGNFTGYVNELGQSKQNSGGVLEFTKDKELIFKEPLALPKGLNSRRIVPLKDQKYLILSNNGKSYIIETSKK